MAMHASNPIIKFADNTTVVDLITNNNETTYREEVRALGVECQEKKLSLKVNKTKEIIVDFRKQQREHNPIYIDGTVVEKVESLKFLGVHIADKLKWSTHTDSVVKKAQQPAMVGLSRGWCSLPNASPGANYLPSRTHTAPDVTGRPKRSSRISSTRATACTTRYHPEGEVSTGASKLGQRD